MPYRRVTLWRFALKLHGCAWRLLDHLCNARRHDRNHGLRTIKRFNTSCRVVCSAFSHCNVGPAFTIQLPLAPLLHSKPPRTHLVHFRAGISCNGAGHLPGRLFAVAAQRVLYFISEVSCNEEAYRLLSQSLASSASRRTALTNAGSWPALQSVSMPVTLSPDRHRWHVDGSVLQHGLRRPRCANVYCSAVRLTTGTSSRKTLFSLAIDASLSGHSAFGGNVQVRRSRRRLRTVCSRSFGAGLAAHRLTAEDRRTFGSTSETKFRIPLWWRSADRR